MEMRRFAVFVTLLLVSFCRASSQSQNANGAEPESCVDPYFGTPIACETDGQPSSQEVQGARRKQSYPMNGSQSLRLPSQLTPNAENAPLTNQNQIGRQERERILPPDKLTEFQRFVAATIGQWLPIYGANLFRQVPTTFAPSELAPASSNYVIGPDDELRIRIWGQVEYSGNLRVDRSGNIFLPQVGSIHVAGLQFSELDPRLREAIGRVYRNYDLSVDLGRIRSMQIYATGQARRPGVYTVSSLSSLVDALFASGGPSPQGSLRHIYVKRDGKTVADFDLYSLLIYGDKSSDVRLLPEDVIYIPPAGPQVAIVGSIRTPGIYELKSDETIGDLIKAAGETSAIASNARISIERIQDREYRTAMEVEFDKEGLATELHNGDILRVFSITPAYSRTVTLRGQVANPGRFGWHPGMHLSDVIPDRDSLVSRDYWWKRSHLGLPGEEFEPLISEDRAEIRQPDIKKELLKSVRDTDSSTEDSA